MKTTTRQMVAAVERRVVPAAEARLHRQGRAEAAARFVAAVGGAALVCLGLIRAIPQQLSVRTDVVGYPIFYGYNIERDLDIYYVVAAGFPLAAFLLYVGLGAVPRLLGWPGLQRSSSLPEAAFDRSPASAWRAGVVAIARLAAVGSSFGLELAIVTGVVHRRFWLVAGGAALAYTLLVAAVSAGASRAGSPGAALLRWTAPLNALLAPLAVTGLAGVAGATTVTVTADGSVHHYRWLPLWLALAATAALLGWVGLQLRRQPSVERARELERRMILTVTGSVVVFLLVAVLPGPMGPMDMFHQGENLAGTRLTMAGYFPWRDLISIHGILQDQLSPIPGYVLFDQSWWGAQAGRGVVLYPAALVFLYLFFAVMFEATWPCVLAALLVIVGGPLTLGYPDARLMFWPLVLLLTWAAVRAGSAWIGAVLGAVLVLQTILVPESAYCLVAVGIVVVLRELTAWKRGQPLPAAFRQTLWLAAGGVGFAAAVAVYLLTQRALQGFILYYFVFVPGHELAGGIPVDPLVRWRDPTFGFEAIAPVVALLLSAWYFGAAFLRRRRLDAIDWVMAAAALFALPYYTKYLGRADGHVLESFTATVPLIGLVAYRVYGMAERWLASERPGAWLRSTVGPRPVAYGLLVAALAGTAGQLLVALPLTAQHLRIQAPSEPALRSAGYSAGDVVDPAIYHDLGAVLKAYLRPGDWVFDFSNQPALYYYLLDQSPHTKYFHVSMAIPEVAQKDLIQELSRDRPKLVVFSDDRYGLPGWDNVPNMVRHYDVSQYILDNYRPLLNVDGQLLYADARADLSSETALHLPLTARPITDGLPYPVMACNWGAAPNYLAISPPSRAAGPAPVTLAVGDAGANVFELSPPPGASWSDYRWLEIDDHGGSIAADHWVMSSDRSSLLAQPQVLFDTLGGSTFRVHVGSCAQWHAYAGAPLYLAHGQAQGAITVRLLP